jgi:tRNA-dihydrouridine synthase A
MHRGIENTPLTDRRVSVAPMMEWTDRHCRYFLRQFSPRVLLYTEMIHASAILRGARGRLLHYSPEEQPLAIQLGGSDPAQLAAAARIAADMGYAEVNLNCGCPSDKVQAGSFGACLMAMPGLVAECVDTMKNSVSVPVTVKLRVGIVSRARCADAQAAAAAAGRFDEEDWAALWDFASGLADAGADALIVHARKAVLGGWSPQENRSVPPLRFDVVERLARLLPPVPVVVNGGIRESEGAIAALRRFDGIMIGREAYHRPWLLREIEQALHPQASDTLTAADVIHAMAEYAARELPRGTRLHAITRHMLGLMSGRPGARELRSLLSAEVQRGLAAEEVFRRAKEIAVLAA